MRTWAEIRDGIVNGIHEMPDDLVPKFNPNSFLYVVETTGLNPQPAANWKYDFGTGVFSVPETVCKTTITSKAFFQRLITNEMESLVTSIDAKVVWFRYWLALSGDMNLEDAQIIAAVQMLESKGIIGVGRAAIILTIEQG